MKTEKENSLLLLIRNGQSMTLRQQLRLTVELSIPSIVAQLSAIAMQYIDAAMVGRLGADAAASIGLVSTTTWLFWGTCSAAATGFSVQVAHHVGAARLCEARAVLRQAILSVALFSLALAGIGALISGSLPVWLGGTDEINAGASAYFLIFALSLPLLQLNFLAGSMLRCSGNMRVPGLLNVLMCLLDVIFNFFLIFPTREVQWFGLPFSMPGAGLGVTWYLVTRSNDLHLTTEHGSFRPTWPTIRKALHISLPMGVEHVVICGAQIMTTVIVAPLGVFAIAANSFGITAESLCYMPGYGIADAATTLVGQSLGAGRKDLTRRFARITVLMGMAVMGVMGIILYAGAPLIMSSMTPDLEVQRLGVEALRIEAFAEPMFAAAIVAYGVFVGAGNTLVPCLMNFFSIWAVRLTLAAALAPSMGLNGVWLAMCIELCCRGIIFLVRLEKGNWMKIKV